MMDHGISTGLDAELGFVLGSLSFLFWGSLVLWMSAGFAMLEAGSVNTRNASAVCLKNIGLLSISTIGFYLIGYDLMNAPAKSGEFLASIGSFHHETAADWEVVTGDRIVGEEFGRGHSAAAEWLFQVVFVASTCAIVSGTLAERVRLLPFFICVAILSTVIYPLVGSWTWGGGWLGSIGFSDYAGSTIVHSTGGWVALAGALVVGARRGKFGPDGVVGRTVPNNVLNSALGIFIIWLGFLGFNGGSRLSLSNAADAVSVGQVIANSMIASFAGFMVSLLLSQLALKKVDPLASFNGLLGGLVAITADPEVAQHFWVVIIGGVGGLVSTIGMRALQRLKIDDEVGAISVHLGAGIWGTLAVCLEGNGDLRVQLIGILTIGAFAFGSSLVAWLVIDRLFGARVSEKAEEFGQDEVELGIQAYPEFIRADRRQAASSGRGAAPV